jgi:hypothetical protein
MKLKHIILIAAACILIGCSPEQEHNNKPDPVANNPIADIGPMVDRMEEAAFVAGVLSAIKSHLVYVDNELNNGGRAPYGFMQSNEWEKQARLVWLKQNPASHTALPKP